MEVCLTSYARRNWSWPDRLRECSRHSRCSDGGQFAGLIMCPILRRTAYTVPDL